MGKASYQERCERYLTPQMIEERGELKETRDCTVIALAWACNVSYKEAHAAMAAEGRKHQRGAHDHQYIAAAKRLGYEVQALPREKWNGATWQKPERLGPGRYWIQKETQRSGHIAAVIDGTMRDWSFDKRFRPNKVYKLKPAWYGRGCQVDMFTTARGETA